MGNYFYAIGDQKHGPCSLDEIKSKNLSENDLVWRDGLPQWVKPSQLPELGIASSTAYNTNPLDSNSPISTTTDKSLFIVIGLGLILFNEAFNALRFFLGLYDGVFQALAALVGLGFGAAPILIAIGIKNDKHRTTGIVLGVIIAILTVIHIVRFNLISTI